MLRARSSFTQLLRPVTIACGCVGTRAKHVGLRPFQPSREQGNQPARLPQVIGRGKFEFLEQVGIGPKAADMGKVGLGHRNGESAVRALFKILLSAN